MTDDAKPAQPNDDIFTEFEHVAFVQRSSELQSSPIETDVLSDGEVASEMAADESGLSSTLSSESSDAAVDVPAEAEPRRSLRERLFGTGGGRKAIALSRMDRLDRAIALYPDAPSNYVLRGEVSIKLGEYARAADDFRHALELATAQTQTDEWGLIAQSIQDRARYGLERAERLLKQTTPDEIVWKNDAV